MLEKFAELSGCGFAIVGSMRRWRTCADEHVCSPSEAAVPVCRAARQHAEPAMRLHL
jgi:hypothetical protein